MGEAGKINKKVFLLIESIGLWLKYFLFFPVFSLFPPPYPYLLCRYLSRLDCGYDSSRKKSIKKWMAELLDEVNPSRKELDLSVRKYFEVMFCDEIDIFIYLVGFSKRFIESIRMEGEENLKEALKSRGGILLSAHFGGGFWILPFLKNRGMMAHFFSADIEKPNYQPFRKALYYYHRMRMWAVEKASGGRVLYKKEGKKGLVEALTEGKWVIILFDVPPFLVRENMEVPFLKRRAWFPKGIVSIARKTNSPLLPFFSFLDEGKRRRICFEKPFYVDDEGECVERCVKLIERRIIERPDHWHFWPIADQFFPRDGFDHFINR